jgi:hypothetical protein
MRVGISLCFDEVDPLAARPAEAGGSALDDEAADAASSTGAAAETVNRRTGVGGPTLLAGASTPDALVAGTLLLRSDHASAIPPSDNRPRTTNGSAVLRLGFAGADPEPPMLVDAKPSTD